MTRSALEHIIRAAARLTDDFEIVVIGSQAILGSLRDPPPSLLVSMEADVYPRNKPERADEIDGAIGEGSRFHQTFGYYAQGVGPETATLPAGWVDRLVAVGVPREPGVSGLCLEVHDLAVSKYVAGREKDLSYTRELALNRITRQQLLKERLAATKLAPDVRKLVVARIDRDFRRGRRPGK